MPSDWLKYGSDLPEKPEVGFIAEACGLDVFSVTGRLMMVWHWFSRQSTDGCVALSSRDEARDNGATVSDQLALDSVRARKTTAQGVFKQIDRVAECEGFAQAMLTCGWLLIEGDSIGCKSWGKHNLGSRKKREMNSVRKRRSRTQDGPARDDGATEARHAQDGGAAVSVTLSRKREIERETSSTPIPPPKADAGSSGGGGDSSSGTIAGESGAGRWFLTAWGLWPNHRRVKQHECRMAWGPACMQIATERGCSPDEAAQWLVSLIDRFRASPKGESEKCPAMHNWLTEARWNDDPATWTLDQKPKPAAKSSPKEPRTIAEARDYLRGLETPDPEADTIAPLEAGLRMCALIARDQVAKEHLLRVCDVLGLAIDEREDALTDLEQRRAKRKQEANS